MSNLENRMRSMMYGDMALGVATRRGWDAVPHTIALANNDEDAIILTHPSNFLTEYEIKAIEDFDNTFRQ